MKKLLSFIGTTNLKETEYKFEQQRYRTSFAQEALCGFFYPDELILFTTEKAKKVNCENIRNACSGKVKKIRVVSIPDGADTNELWNIFTIISGEVQDGDNLIFDLTHSFRTIPFICFLSVIYLKEIKNVSIERIVYARLEEGPDGTSPVLDLTDFSTIVDWMSAVHSFTRQVNASELSSLIEKIHTQAYRSGNKKKPYILKKFAGSLDTFTSSILLSRPINAITSAQDLMKKLDRAKEEVTEFIPALVPVMDQIRDVDVFATPGNPMDLSGAMLRTQWDLVQYQIKNGLTLQAVELAREWFVNYIILRICDEPENWLHKKTREAIEKTLNYEKEIRRGKDKPKSLKETNFNLLFRNLPDCNELVKYWSSLSDLRNNLAHCGMNSDTKDIKTLLDNAHKLLDKIGNHYPSYPVPESDKSG